MCDCEDLLIGVGLRPTHYPYLETTPQIQTNWFEIISENFMNTEGRPIEVLEKMRERFPIGMHGVALSIGSDKSPDPEYLKRLKRLADRIKPHLLSDHLCWSQAPSGNTHDLLPVPQTKEALKRILENLEAVQTFLGRQILLENISYYLRFKENEIEETDFINQICKSSGCGLLLDLNNVYVNSINHGFNAVHFIDRLNLSHVKQIHIAGPSQQPGFLFDTHSSPVPNPVWDLLTYISEKVSVPILLEWDEDIPEFSVLEDEVNKARLTVKKVTKK